MAAPPYVCGGNLAVSGGSLLVWRGSHSNRRSAVVLFHGSCCCTGRMTLITPRKKPFKRVKLIFIPRLSLNIRRKSFIIARKCFNRLRMRQGVRLKCFLCTVNCFRQRRHTFILPQTCSLCCLKRSLFIKLCQKKISKDKHTTAFNLHIAQCMQLHTTAKKAPGIEIPGGVKTYPTLNIIQLKPVYRHTRISYMETFFILV